MSKARAAPVYFARNTMLFLVFELAESFGVSQDSILSEIGLNPALLEGVGAKVPAHMIVDAVECAAAKTGRNDFGLLLGERFDHRMIGPLGLLIEQSETLGEALKTLLRYFHLHNTSVKFTLVRQGSRTLVRVNLLEKGKFEARHFILGLMVAVVRFARLYLGQKWKPVLVMFERKRIASIANYERLLGPHLRFEQTMTATAFIEAELSRRISSREPEVKNRLAAMLRELDAVESSDVLSRVSRFVRKSLPLRQATIKAVAAQMAMTPRTLQRRLDAQGRSFMSIVADVRFEMAREYFRGGALTTAQVAPLLGLSESSAVNRFLRDHANVRPRDLR